MPRLPPDQRAFVKGCTAHYLDNAASKPHSAPEMARWAANAYRASHPDEPRIKVGASQIVALINELRDEGYLIQRDPGGKGYKCLVGKRNGTTATLDVLGILKSLQHEKARIATSLENQVLKPSVTVQQTVICNVPLDQAAALVNELRAPCGIDDAVGKLRELGTAEYRLVPAARVAELQQRAW